MIIIYLTQNCLELTWLENFVWTILCQHHSKNNLVDTRLFRVGMNRKFRVNHILSTIIFTIIYLPWNYLELTQIMSHFVKIIIPIIIYLTRNCLELTWIKNSVSTISCQLLFNNNLLDRKLFRIDTNGKFHVNHIISTIIAIIITWHEIV